MAPEVTRSTTRRRRGVLFTLAATGALGIALAWPQVQRVQRIRAGLPPLPSAIQPAALDVALREAAQAARSWRPAFAAIAQLGALYHANGFDREADACWTVLAREQPNEARWAYLRADLRRRSGDYPGVTALLEQTNALDRSYAPAWLKRADLEFKAGMVDAAAGHYARRLQLLPQDPYARLGLARIALLRGQPGEATALLLAILHDEPRFASARNLYAELLAAAGNTDQARVERWLGREAGRYREPPDLWLDELEAACLDPQALQLLANVKFQTNEPQRARALMERAAELAPARLSLHEALGDLCLKLGDPAGARAALERGVAAASATVPSIAYYVYWNQAYRQLGAPADALRVLRPGLERYADAFELHNALGLTLQDLHQPAEATAAYARAVALSPADAECNFNLGVARLEQEQYDDARRCLQRSLTLQPTFPKALKLLAKLELAAERADAAAAYLLPLYDAQPGDPQVTDLMVEWHLLAGRPAEAKKVLLTARGIANTLGNAAEIGRIDQYLRQLP